MPYANKAGYNNRSQHTSLIRKFHMSLSISTSLLTNIWIDWQTDAWENVIRKAHLIESLLQVFFNKGLAFLVLLTCNRIFWRYWDTVKSWDTCCWPYTHHKSSHSACLSNLQDTCTGSHWLGLYIYLHAYMA